jgi:hypothetical protein
MALAGVEMDEELKGPTQGVERQWENLIARSQSAASRGPNIVYTG